jgi:hypothetical protein
MKFDKEAAQSQLDLAANELEKSGFADLAEKVDYYNNRLMKAGASEIPLIKRALHRIQQEAKKRLSAAQKAKPATKEDKANAATLKSRRSSESRKETLKRRLKSIVARRKKAAEKLEALRTERQQRRSKKEQRRHSRKKRISKESE